MTGLRRIQIGLWVMAGVATLAYGAFVLLPNRDAQMGEAFRPVFALPNGADNLRTSAEFTEKFQLVFFGFTNCPDVCPTTLSEVAQVMDDLGDEAALVQPIFISIDPERDRKLGLDAFTQAFHPAILGLAGDVEATKAAAASFKIFFAPEAALGATDGYSMSHSSALYLVGPKGDWLRQFDYGTPAADILADLKSRL